MATWQSPAGVDWCAGGGEKKTKETTIRLEAKTASVCKTGWIYTWHKSAKTYIIAGQREWLGTQCGSR